MIIYRLTLGSMLCLVATAGCSAREVKEGGHVDACMSVIADYVKTSRGWGRDLYDIVPEGKEGPLRGYAVMHRDDKGRLPSEELKSFHVDLNSSCKAVVAELGYQ
ncbi:hypothetical protein MOQ07_03575 [Stenotrophomonas maltophilia]|nr:hypothetical protein [Stenotrophomonas maltophilia]MCI1085720.1 hypothetical protein [Stenotrophomonas maltophilia]MCI1114767.1 hypothetical protein [Stenotrophomonas maltophilia]